MSCVVAASPGVGGPLSCRSRRPWPCSTSGAPVGRLAASHTGQTAGLASSQLGPPPVQSLTSTWLRTIPLRPCVFIDSTRGSIRVVFLHDPGHLHSINCKHGGGDRQPRPVPTVPQRARHARIRLLGAVRSTCNIATRQTAGSNQPGDPSSSALGNIRDRLPAAARLFARRILRHPSATASPPRRDSPPKVTFRHRSPPGRALRPG